MQKGNPEVAVLARQRLPSGKDDYTFKAALVRLDAAAKEAVAVIALVIATDDFKGVLALADVVEDIATVDICEEDPDYLYGFAVKWHGLDTLQPLGYGHSFVQVRRSSDGYTCLAKPFMGDTFENRLIHAGIGAGISQTQIAEDLGVSRSTISRQARAHRLCPVRNKAEEWYTKGIAQRKAGAEKRDGDQ